MASCPALFEDYLQCPVCRDVFKDPVLLMCSHSFCRLCLEQFWQLTEVPTCPLCRASSSVNHPPCNLALKNLCEAFVQECNQTASAGAEILCELHNKKLTLYCLEDKQPVCVECQTSKIHDKHCFKLLDEVAVDLKLDLKRKLAPLKERLKLLRNAKHTCFQTEHYIKCQAHYTESLIRREFEKIHQFLWDEESTRVSALREEEKQRAHAAVMKMTQINRDILVLSDKVAAIKEGIEANNISFLQNHEATVKRAECEQKDPEIYSASPIDVAKHLGNLKFRVWEKMLSIIKYTPVVLDPNTAHSCLYLTENLTSMELRNGNPELPVSPLRFTDYSSVLGSEGFDSGKHCWDIEVGNSSAWAVGVISESAYKHREILSKQGLWHIGYYKGKYGQGLSDEMLTPISVKEKLQRIRVLLDWEGGYVAFFDSVNDTHVHTFVHTFTERVYPYFCNACPDKALRIVPVGLSITEE
ncbi:E3 ubiquitin-protein ligase TRIM35-like [Pangasianodon hypophthalmus]|uniref:E3 ubiquitin-protein ligase TRIM35-like n=1 Tax=Pangasianodon hypophthalmus TaxID=310915 RepID=UPI00230710EA|nr:E3 ubiquitin-protein ligase TRIM35-like [Pangasianodon hypophthalmus]